MVRWPVGRRRRQQRRRGGSGWQRVGWRCWQWRCRAAVGAPGTGVLRQVAPARRRRGTECCRQWLRRGGSAGVRAAAALGRPRWRRRGARSRARCPLTARAALAGAGHRVSYSDRRSRTLRRSPRSRRQSVVHRCDGSKIGRDHGRPASSPNSRLPASQRCRRLITGGPDGNVWFTEAASRKSASITPTGTITESTRPAQRRLRLQAGPDGNLWFTRIARPEIEARCRLTRAFVRTRRSRRRDSERWESRG